MYLRIAHRLVFSNLLKLSKHAALHRHVAEDAVFLLDQIPRGIEFGDDTLIQHNESVIVDYTPQTMRN